MEQYITAGLIGSLVTIVIQAITNAISERVKHKRELRSLVFQRKLEVVEKAMSWYQETLDMYYMLQTTLKEYDKDCSYYSAKDTGSLYEVQQTVSGN